MDDTLVQAVAKGIRSVAPAQLQTIELNYETSSSFGDPTWIPIIDRNGTYTYSPTYMQMLHSYNQKPIVPVFPLEAHYDLENVGHSPGSGTTPTLRREEYWTMLSGGTARAAWSIPPTEPTQSSQAGNSRTGELGNSRRRARITTAAPIGCFS